MSESNMINILSSATAGVVGRLFCHPIDTIKSKLQANDSFRGMTDVVKTTIRNEGVAGLYRGLSAVVVGSAPGVCVYMSSYEESKRILSTSELFRGKESLNFFISGMIAEAACCAIFIPIDVVKERLQVQSLGQPYQYKGSIDGFRTILNQEGLRGLYKGYFATLASYGPFSALYFSIYEKMKTVFKKTDSKKELNFLENLTSSAVAGAVASFVTNPLEIAKLRFQIQVNSADGAVVKTGNSNGVTYRNVLHALSDIYKTMGFRGLLRGAGTRILFHTPNTAITMAVYEECKKIWSQVIKTS